MIRDATNYLKHLTRYGLDKKVLSDYRSYGIVYCSQPTAKGSIKTFEFIDVAGIEQEWIDTINSFEEDGICIYHIINNSTDTDVELDCLYYFSEDIDYDEQFKEFKSGTAKVIRYFPLHDRPNRLEIGTLTYRVVKGGLVEVK